MTRFVFYRQQREDGGRRTGLEINGETVWGEYDAGKYDDDPTLRWSVDLRGEGDSIPHDQSELRQWLLDHRDLIEGAFRRLADRFEVGFDNGAVPVRWQIPDSPDDTTLVIAIHVLHRADAVRVAEILTALAAEWQRTVSQVPALIPAA